MKIDRSILQANDQNIGDFGDPNKLENSIEHLANVIDANDNDTSALKTDNTANKTNITTLQTDISTLKTDNTSNKTRLTTLENDNTSNKSRIGTLETDNTSNKGRITTNENNIAYDQARLDNLLRNTQQASEVVDARTKADGTSFPLLGDRLNNVDEQLDKKVMKGELIVNVKDFGAKGDGVTDDTVAIQSAIDYIRNNPIVSGVYTVYRTLFFQFGVYVVADSLNFTGFRSRFHIDLGYSTVIGKFTGYPIFDFTDSRYYHLTNGSIYGDTTTTPSVGILQARRSLDDRVASDNFISNVTVSGNFTISALANISSEMSRYENCRFENNYNGDSTVTTALFANQNIRNIVSKYQTITANVVSAILHTLSRCSFYRRNSTGGACVELYGIHRMVWADDVYIMCDGGLAGVKLSYVTNTKLKWHQERETTGTDYFCYVDGTKGDCASLELNCAGFIKDTAITGVLVDQASTLKDSFIKAAKIKVQHSTNATYLYNNTFISRDDTGLIDLSGAKYFRGHLEAQKISNITWQVTGKSDFYGDVLVAGNYFKPKFVYTTAINASFELTTPKPYTQINNSSDLKTITIGDVHYDGSEIYVRAYGGNTITVKHNVGNIYTKDGLDYTLSNIAYTKFVYDGTLGKWLMQK